jgi:hypothetical protein
MHRSPFILSLTRVGVLTTALLGCEPPAPDAPYPVTFESVSDPGAPLAGVLLRAAEQDLGTTDASGRLSIELAGREGAVVPVVATCPTGHRPATDIAPLVLRRTIDLTTGRAVDAPGLGDLPPRATPRGGGPACQRRGRARRHPRHGRRRGSGAHRPERGRPRGPRARTGDHRVGDARHLEHPPRRDPPRSRDALHVPRRGRDLPVRSSPSRHPRPQSASAAGAEDALLPSWRRSERAPATSARAPAADSSARASHDRAEGGALLAPHPSCILPLGLDGLGTVARRRGPPGPTPLIHRPARPRPRTDWVGSHGGGALLAPTVWVSGPRPSGPHPPVRARRSITETPSPRRSFFASCHRVRWPSFASWAVASQPVTPLIVQVGATSERVLGPRSQRRSIEDRGEMRLVAELQHPGQNSSVKRSTSWAGEERQHLLPHGLLRLGVPKNSEGDLVEVPRCFAQNSSKRAVSKRSSAILPRSDRALAYGRSIAAMA